jgi:hypothetical protein
LMRGANGSADKLVIYRPQEHRFSSPAPFAIAPIIIDAIKRTAPATRAAPPGFFIARRRIDTTYESTGEAAFERKEKRVLRASSSRCNCTVVHLLQIRTVIFGS